jgi:hypothetical protein
MSIKIGETDAADRYKFWFELFTVLGFLPCFAFFGDIVPCNLLGIGGVHGWSGSLLLNDLIVRALQTTGSAGKFFVEFYYLQGVFFGFGCFCIIPTYPFRPRSKK